MRDGNEPKEFSSIELTQYSDLTVTKYESISEVLELYYSERNTYTRIRQKSADTRNTHKYPPGAKPEEIFPADEAA